MNIFISVPALLKRRSPDTSDRLVDETLLFNESQIEFLARRGLIHLTTRPGEIRAWGTVIAANSQHAAKIAADRDPRETSIGLMSFGFLGELRNRISTAIAFYRHDRP